MAGTRLQQSSSISQLTSQPETIPSCYRRSRHAEFQPLSGRQLRSHFLYFTLARSATTCRHRRGRIRRIMGG
jgi:hypothetical protein